MHAVKRKKLEAAGYQVGSADDFLGLTPQESEYLDLKIKLSTQLREIRRIKKMSQEDMARYIGSSQSRVAKMESGDSSVSVDLLVKSLIAVGSTTKDLGRALSGETVKTKAAVKRKATV